MTKSQSARAAKALSSMPESQGESRRSRWTKLDQSLLGLGQTTMNRLAGNLKSRSASVSNLSASSGADIITRLGMAVLGRAETVRVSLKRKWMSRRD